MFLKLVRIAIRSAERSRRRQQIESIATTPLPPTRGPWESKEQATVLSGPAYVIDGDTIVIEKVRIRLAGIDAPEMNHPYGRNAKTAVINMCRGKIITARLIGELSYERSVAICTLPDGRDIAAELVKMGLALDWPTFSGGRYRHLETADARRKLWRADAKQKGRIIP